MKYENWLDFKKYLQSLGLYKSASLIYKSFNSVVVSPELNREIQKELKEVNNRIKTRF